MLNSYNNQQQPPPVQRNLFQVPKRACTGVDKLILAAMMNEAYGGQSQSHTGSTPCPSLNYLPSGRGLGYFPNSARAPQYPTSTQIPTPSNKSELELYRLLERANLLNYFGTFINFGGDDVQQLCDADEEEFLEIMSLVGMTQKPLHVRRLQKALIEWREAKELENTFRRPQPTTNYLYYTGPVTGSGNNSSKVISNDSFNSNRQVASTTSFVESPFSNPPSVSSRSSEQHYALPQELVGAPKRIRLMDDLHKKPVPEPSPNREKARNLFKSNTDNSLFNKTDNCPLMASSPKLPQSPLNEGDGDDQKQDVVERDEDEDDNNDDGKLIEIIESSHSDLELDESITNATCGSIPVHSKKYSHNKYGRYKASLETAKSPKNPKP